MKINIVVCQIHDPIMFGVQTTLGYIMEAHIVNIVLSVNDNILLHCDLQMGGGGAGGAGGRRRGGQAARGAGGARGWWPWQSGVWHDLEMTGLSQLMMGCDGLMTACVGLMTAHDCHAPSYDWP